MATLISHLIAAAVAVLNLWGAVPRTAHYPLTTADGLRLHNVAVEPAVLAGRSGLRVTLDGETLRRFRAMTSDQVNDVQARIGQYAVVDSLELSDGVIAAEVAGALAPDADGAARGFVGIAFRLRDGAYDVFTLRMTNGRAEEQERRNHATQYASHPDWPWFRLRKETPGRYESYVDLAPNVWTKVRIDVRGNRARLYVHDQQQPTLVVNDLKSGTQRSGCVALWVNHGTIAYFRNLTVTPH
jgi:hypothetical protein